MDKTTLPVCHTDQTVLYSVEWSATVADYESLLRSLHHDPAISVKSTTFKSLLGASNELLVFVEADGRLVATAQGSLSRTEPTWQVLVNNVVVHGDHQGRGHGRRIMHALEQAVWVRWGESGTRPLKLLLTNSPQKQNAGFYTSVGWTARTEDNQNPTVVWEKMM